MVNQKIEEFPVSTFDIETIGWTEPIAVGFYEDGSYKDFLKVSSEVDVIWEFLQYIKTHAKNKVIHAHNSTNFDNKFILETLIKHNQTIDLEGGLGSLKWKEANISFRDSHRLLRTSLAKACEAFGVDSKLEWDHKKTVPIWDMPADRLVIFRAYLERDCRALSKAFGYFVNTLLGTFSLDNVGTTLGQTALRIFDSFYDLTSIDSNEQYHKQIRSALYGGRNEIYNRYGEDVNLYDIRSMYVSCYETEVPVGPMKFLPSTQIDKLNLTRGTLAYAKVHVPEYWFIGPLPYHMDTSLLFPVGKFEGWWDMKELRYAKSLGVKVDLLQVLECEEVASLKEFGEIMLGLRYQAYVYDNFELTRLWKALGVQLVGKFAQSTRRTKIKHISNFKTIQEMEGWTFIDKDEQYLEGDRVPNKQLKEYINKTVKPAVAMRIRAEARIRHHKWMMQAQEQVGPEGLFYCDTDSIYTKADLDSDLGTIAGSLQYLDKAERAYFVMRKFYGYVTPEGVLRQRSSGFSGYRLSETQFKDLLEGSEIRIVTQGSTLTAPLDIIRGNSTSSLHKERVVRSSTIQNRHIEKLTTKPICL